MSERTGKVLEYFPANRQGKIQPDDKGPAALFYVTSVTNNDPAPKRGDTVVFDAPAPRKNKQGKPVQDQATSVTITERAPEPTPEELARKARREEAGRGRGGDRRGGDRRGGGRNAGGRSGPGGAGSSRPGAGRSGPGGNDRGRNDRSRAGQGPAGSAPARSAGSGVDARGPRGRGAPSDSRGSGARGPASARRSGLGAGEPGRRRARGADRSVGAQKKVSIRAKVRYPSCRDVSKSALHLELSNPSLVAQKYIQWPAPVDPKASGASWRLTAKNQSFFVTRTLAPLYRNFEKKTLPWAAVRGRRESVLRALEQAGYQLASDIVRGPWRFAIAQQRGVLLDEAALSFDPIYGYPQIPASSLQRLLAAALQNPELNKETVSEQLRAAVDAAAQGASHAELELVLLDAVPTGRVQQFSIERCELVTAESLLQSTPTPQAVGALHAMCIGQDAGFALSVAVKGKDANRATAQQLIATLSAGLRAANALGVKDGSKEPERLPQAVLF